MARVVQGEFVRKLWDEVGPLIGHRLYPDIDIPDMVGEGICVNSTCTANSKAGSFNTTYGAAVEFQTAASDTSTAFIETPSVFGLAQGGIYKGRVFPLYGTTDVRFWVVLTDGTNSDFAGSDGPAKNYIGFRYSTVEGGSDFNCVAKDGSTESLETTGINFDIDRFAFEIRCENETEVTCRIYDYTNTLVYEKTWTDSDNLPAAATALKLLVLVEAKGAAMRAFSSYYHDLVPRT